MNITPAQEEFVRRFQEYEKNQAAYKGLSEFLKARSFGELRDCLSIYFEGEVYKPYVDRDGHKRALTVFYDLCFNVLSRSAPGEDLYFALRLEVLIQNESAIWHSFFVELDIKQQRTLTSQISRQKAKLSWTQKAFLREFDLLMQQGSKQGAKRFTDWILAVKIEPLKDCLRAYVEVSQKYSDNDRDSLNAFYTISFRALGIGDSYFATNYERLIHSEGTVWKRRYDALETWQRTEKLDPAIREKKQVVIEKKGSVGGKEFTASEIFTVPSLSPTSPDLEKKGRVSLPTKTQREFIDLFKKFMNSRDAQPKALTEYVFNLSRQRLSQQLTECVEAYLQASVKYDEKDERSLYVFFGTASLAIRANDAYYASKFDASIHASGTTLAKRFAALGALKPSDQATLRADLDKMLKNPRILDELKFAYFEKEKKEPTLQALRIFEFVSDPEVFKSFSKMLDKCNRAFQSHRGDDFSAGFRELAQLLLAQKNRLLLVTLLKRCREAKEVVAILRHELSWYLIGILYLQALKDHPEVYLQGFNEQERQFLFDATDVADPYFADFVIRLEYLWRHHGPGASRIAGTASRNKLDDPDEPRLDEFSLTIEAYCELLLFASQIGAGFVPLVQTAQVQGLVEELRKEKGQKFLYEIRIPINSRYDHGKTLSINDPIGRHFIAWSDSSGTYVELDRFEGLLFRVDSDWLGRVYDNDAVWGEVYRSTEGLLVVIPMLFDVLGYLPDLVSGGVTGLVKSVFINLAIEKTAHALGLNSTAVQLALLGAGLITHHALSGKKGAPARGRAEPIELQGETVGRLTENQGARNRRTEPPPEASSAVADNAVPGHPPLDPDMRGIQMKEGSIFIRGEEHAPFGSAPGTANQHTDNRLASSDGVANRGTSSSSVPDAPAPAATRQDLALAEASLKDAQNRFESAKRIMEQKKDRVGDIEANIEEAQGKRGLSKLEKEVEDAKKAAQKAVEDYRNRGWELRAAQSKVDRMTGELARRGELRPSLRFKWNLPERPTKFRQGSVEAESWRSDAYVGTSDDRRTLERILNENPNGELSKHLLKNGRLFPANIGDMQYWTSHPEVVELAHVLSKREAGREVFIVMTKARNQTFSANLERTGGILKEDAIVIQGVAIDRVSAMQLGVPQTVIERAQLIQFAK